MNPRVDYAQLYDHAYYLGEGADPDVDYLHEMQDRSTIRELEWSGLEASLRSVDPSARVLDFGCGLGGLVRYLRAAGWNAEGFEDEGYARSWMMANRLPVVSELPPQAYDVVFAVEVMEHLIDPPPALEAIRETLKPGGRLIITTGNFAKAKQPLAEWYYAAIPDVHVTFWTPSSWNKALVDAGFTTDSEPSLSPAVTQYKILKALPRPLSHLRRVSRLWRLVAKVIDRRYGISEFATGIRPAA